MIDHSTDGGSLEEVGAIDDAPDDAVRSLVQLDVEIELGGAGSDLGLTQVPSIEDRAPRLGQEHDVEQRMTASVALGVHFANHMVEGDVAGG